VCPVSHPTEPRLLPCTPTPPLPSSPPPQRTSSHSRLPFPTSAPMPFTMAPLHLCTALQLGSPPTTPHALPFTCGQATVACPTTYRPAPAICVSLPVPTAAGVAYYPLRTHPPPHNASPFADTQTHISCGTCEPCRTAGLRGCGTSSVSQHAHPLLPHLVLVACCPPACFASAWPHTSMQWCH
jgi:hypothetical protein